MALKTAGSYLYVTDPNAATKEWILLCSTTFGMTADTKEEIDITTLCDTVSKTLPGATTLGDITGEINFDPEAQGAIALANWFKAGTTGLLYAISFSNTDAQPPVEPTIASPATGTFSDLPTDRSWLVGEGYIADFSVSMELNNVVKAPFTIKRTADWSLIDKV